MPRYFLIALSVFLAGFTVDCAVFAQIAPALQEKSSPIPPPAARIEDLFEKLKSSKNQADARNFADQIQRIWARSGSDTADLLMQRAAKAVESKDTDLALDLLDSILSLAPGWSEAWQRRATIHLLRRDLDGAMRDLNVVLSREPRHYRAWMELGAVLMQVDRKKSALVAMKRAADLHPHHEQLSKIIERLAAEVEGQGI